MRRYSVADAARRDSTELDAVFDPDNTCANFWADSAYRSAKIEEKLAERGFKSCIHRRGAQNLQNVTFVRKSGRKVKIFTGVAPFEFICEH